MGWAASESQERGAGEGAYEGVASEALGKLEVVTPGRQRGEGVVAPDDGEELASAAQDSRRRPAGPVDKALIGSTITTVVQSRGVKRGTS